MGPAMYRYIEEYVPDKHLSASFAGITILGSVAHLLSELSVLILPADADTQALKDNKTWIICEGMPSVFCLFTVIGLLTLVRYDSAQFYLYSSEDDSLAKTAIHKMYITDGSDELATRIAASIRSKSTSATNKVTLKEAFLTDEKYNRASWISVITMSFTVLNGFGPIAGYANNLYSFFLDDTTFIDPR